MRSVVLLPQEAAANNCLQTTDFPV